MDNRVNFFKGPARQLRLAEVGNLIARVENWQLKRVCGPGRFHVPGRRRFARCHLQVIGTSIGIKIDCLFAGFLPRHLRSIVQFGD